MAPGPSVLVLDDGELDRVEPLLAALDADFVRLEGREIGAGLEQPRDLLITSGTRALDMPEMSGVPGDAAPVWVCLHSQDFLPLRNRLRELGVHFLVQMALDQESLRLFLLQLLHRGAEQRGSLRLPLGGMVAYEAAAGQQKAKLCELAADSCRILGPEQVAPGQALRVFLPSSLCGGVEMELAGTAIRSSGLPAPTGAELHSTVVGFRDLEPAAREQLAAVMSGAQIGTRLTPLAGLPEADREDRESQSIERRRQPRQEYRRRVDAFRSFAGEEPVIAIGVDLSIEGIRIVDRPGIPVGSRLTLALYGGRREEPIMVEAIVVREDPGGLALRFDSVRPEQRAQLEKLAVGLPALRSLDGHEDPPLIVSRLVARGG